MLYTVGKLFSKVEYIELSAVFVFAGLQSQPKINSYKESLQLALAFTNCSSGLALAKLTFSLTD